MNKKKAKVTFSVKIKQVEEGTTATISCVKG